jgi:hypothetical protein
LRQGTKGRMQIAVQSSPEGSNRKNAAKVYHFFDIAHLIGSKLAL